MKFDHRFVLTDSTPSMRAYHADGVTMRLDFFNNILRVALLRDALTLLPTWSVCPGEEDCPLEGRDKLSAEGFETQTPDVEETEELLHFSLGGAERKKAFCMPTAAALLITSTASWATARSTTPAGRRGSGSSVWATRAAR